LIHERSLENLHHALAARKRIQTAEEFVEDDGETVNVSSEVVFLPRFQKFCQINKLLDYDIL
jgi:hypothetical protein